MNLGDIAVKAMSFGPDAPVSKAVSEMYRGKATDALIFDNSRYLGLITARDIVKRNISEPDKVKIGSLKSAIHKIKPFPYDTDIPTIIRSMLTNGYKSVPVKKGDEYLVATKLGILRLFPKECMKGKSAKDIMTFPHCVGADDSLAVAKSILRQMGVYRLVVINEKGTADGVIDTSDLLRASLTKDVMSTGEPAAGNIKADGVLASSSKFMRSRFFRAGPDTPVEDIARKMLKTGASTAVIEDDKFHGIVTPTDIFKLLTKEVSGIYVRVTGQQDEDIFLRSVIDEEIRNEVKKLSRMLPVQYMTLHIDKSRTDGKRTQYTIKAKIATENGTFFAHADAWDITKAMHELMGRFEREIKRKQGKARNYNRRGVFIRDKI